MSICHDYDDTFFGIVTVAALPSARGTASGVALRYGDYCPVTSRAAGICWSCQSCRCYPLLPSRLRTMTLKPLAALQVPT